jgi:hypothetical protein
VSLVLYCIFLPVTLAYVKGFMNSPRATAAVSLVRLIVLVQLTLNYRCSKSLEEDMMPSTMILISSLKGDSVNAVMHHH